MPSEREVAESQLSQTLRSTLGPVEVEVLVQPLVQSLAQACHLTQLARRLHNDAAVAAIAVRRKRVVRWLRLAGSAPMPRTVEFDDQPPASLRSPGVPGG